MTESVKSTRFFFPCMGIDAPMLERHFMMNNEWSVAKRLWPTTPFDIATLAVKHRLHLHRGLMEAFLGGVNCEIAIGGVDNHRAASDRARLLQAMLYLESVAPFIMPFAATHSINEYSGINSRDSSALIEALPEGLRDGITSATSTVEVWPHELTLHYIKVQSGRVVTVEAVDAAVNSAAIWRGMESAQPLIKVARLALLTAPTIPDIGSSLLHIWQGIESLFPNVQMEVSFRISLLIAQLASGLASAKETYGQAKKSYNDRSKVAHGNLKSIGMGNWLEAWNLLKLCLKSIATRRKLPNENELMVELLEERSGHTTH
jgi:hypothetical protein